MVSSKGLAWSFILSILQNFTGKGSQVMGRAPSYHPASSFICLREYMFNPLWQSVDLHVNVRKQYDLQHLQNCLNSRYNTVTVGQEVFCF